MPVAIARTRWIGALAALLVLGACASTEEEYVEQSVEYLYNQGMDALQDGSYKTAAKAFDEVERQHPYSLWATKAQLMAAYAHYEDGKYDDAIAALDRYIQLHPGSPEVSYAYYLKALCYYEQISDVARDQSFTTAAMRSLQEVVDRFPNSAYARDARLKIELARDHLAGKEMTIGRYYLRQKHFLAAINRFKNVVDHYQTTTHVPEALHRLSEAYYSLGLVEEARKTAAVLGHNYPGSQWYVDAYALVEDPSVRPRKDDGWFDWLKFW